MLERHHLRRKDPSVGVSVRCHAALRATQLKRPRSAAEAQQRCWAPYWTPDLFLDPSVLADPQDGREVLKPPKEESCTIESQRLPECGIVRFCAAPRQHAEQLLLAAGGGGGAWLRPLYQEQSVQSQAALVALASLLVAAQLGAWIGFVPKPPLVGKLSALMAAGGSVSALLSMAWGPSAYAEQLPPACAATLAILCGALAPLPLSLLPRLAVAGAGVGGTMRLALPGAVGAAVAFEVMHRYWASIDPSRVATLRGAEQEALPALGSTATDGGGGAAPGLVARAGQHVWRHFCPSFAGGERGLGTVFFSLSLAVSYLSVHLDFVMTEWRKVFLNALQARDVAGFTFQLKEFASIAGISLLLSAYGGYLTTMWDLRWREELTRDFMDMWLDRKSYYYVRFTGTSPNGSIDNFDQRIVEDTALFASTSRGLLCGAVGAAMRLAVFGPALIRLSPSPLVWQVCIASSVISSVGAHIIGHRLAARNAAAQRAEADFRASLMRVRIFAEDVALQNGEAAEGALATSCFEGIKAATWLTARTSLNLAMFTSAYGLVSGIFPFLVLVPYYFHGQMTIGLMFQIEAIVGGLRQSLDFFINAYPDLAEWQASAGRLLALEACVVEAPRRQLTDTVGSRPAQLSVQDLTLAAPGSSSLLLDGVSFCWPAGALVRLCGPSGSGKSLLLRTLACAGPPQAAGTGSTPDTTASNLPGARALLLSSGGFRLPRATLRRCLAYPEAIAPFDSDLQEALCACGLRELADQLDVEADWASDLPLADLQRLVFVRFAARWPAHVQWLFLDEVDGALDGPTAIALYKRLAERRPPGVGVVAVSRHLDAAEGLDGWRRVDLHSESKSLQEEPVVLAEDLAGTAAGLAAVEPCQ